MNYDIKRNSRSVNSMVLTLKMLKNVKNIEITDFELSAFID